MKSTRWKLVLGFFAGLMVLAALAYRSGQTPTVPPDLLSPIVPWVVVDSDPDGAGLLPSSLPRIEGSLVVDFVDGTTADQLRAFNRETGLMAQYNSIHSVESCLTVMQVSEDAMAATMAEIASRSEVTSVSPNYIYTTCSFPNDPEFKYQWHMSSIGMEDAWRWSSGQGVTVAVIDTGVAYMNFGDRFRQVEDLADTAFTDGYDFINRRVEAVDDHAHGTHVAGTIAQSTNNGKGVTGIAFGSTVMPVKVLGGDGSGTLAGVADGIRFAADHGAGVMNLSLGSPSPARPLDDAVAHAVSRGCVVVCAAGNSAAPRSGFPAGCPGALSVSALDYEKNLTFYSNYGPSISIAAPGGDTRADKNGDGMLDGVYQNTIIPGQPASSVYLNFQGTSMAAPHVAGVFALAESLGVTDRAAVEKLVFENTSPAPEGAKEGYGAGILDARRVTHTAGLLYGCKKLLYGFAAGALAMGLMVRRRRLFAVLAMVPGVMFGACGILFLVPALGLNSAPLCAYLTTGFPGWDMLWWGSAAHGSPFTHSLLAPALVGLVCMAIRFLRPVAAGFAAGVAGHLFFVWQYHTLNMEWLSGGLQPLWLLANGLVCVALATALASRE